MGISFLRTGFRFLDVANHEWEDRCLAVHHFDWSPPDRLNCATTRKNNRLSKLRGARMAGESVHDKLGRVRAPRVHITYQVETGGAMVMKELPFVMGVLGDFTSNPKETDKKLKERDFVEVNMQNFDKVLKEMAPTLNFTAANKLSSDPNAGEIPIDLKFESLGDFAPDRVAQQVEPLKKLLDLRTK